MRLLVVEDAPDVLRLVRGIFVKEGYEVRTARDGQEGVDMALEDPPDAVLLDVNLPRLSGHEACKMLRADKRTKHAAIIFMSAAYVEVADLERADRTGADAYVVKPFVRAALIDSVKHAIEARKSTK